MALVSELQNNEVLISVHYEAICPRSSDRTQLQMSGKRAPQNLGQSQARKRDSMFPKNRF